MTHAISGVHCAVATPVTADGTPDLALFAAHCRTLLEDGCHGIAMWGTTGEANSFGLDQRQALLDAAIAADIPAETLLPGTGANSVADTLELTRHAVQSGAKGVVMLPPCYYKGVSDEGLFRFYARVIEGVADTRLRVVLYHIPQVSQIPLSHELIDRLLRAFPGIVVGIKDSSGDMANMTAMTARFPDLGVLAGADPLMLPLLRAGGAGCITASSNMRADALRVVWEGWNDPDQAQAVEAAQARIDAWRGLTNAYVQLPTVKAMLAKRYGTQDWLRVQPPLVEVSAAERADIWARMDRLDAAQ